MFVLCCFFLCFFFTFPCCLPEPDHCHLLPNCNGLVTHLFASSLLPFGLFQHSGQRDSVDPSWPSCALHAPRTSLSRRVKPPVLQWPRDPQCPDASRSDRTTLLPPSKRTASLPHFNFPTTSPLHLLFPLTGCPPSRDFFAFSSIPLDLYSNVTTLLPCFICLNTWITI